MSDRPTELHWSEALILMAMRTEPERACGSTELARRVNAKPRQLWMGFVRLHARGYAQQLKPRGPWVIRWERVALCHRGACLPMLDDPEALIPLGQPTWAVRLARWILAHIPGASWVGDEGVQDERAGLVRRRDADGAGG